MATLIIGLAGAGGLVAQPVESLNVSEDASSWEELAFWEFAKDSNNPEKLRAYIDRYPEGRFVTLARARIKTLAAGAAMPVASAGLQAGATIHDCDICPQLVVIPAGQFEMGSNNHGAREMPSHRVTIPQAFAMGIYEITVAEWGACLREGVCRQSVEPDQQGTLPIANVSWDDARDYVQWLSRKTGQTYRLPSEAEWEYAARAGAATRYWWGDERGIGKANCTDCKTSLDGKGATPAGSFEANRFGLYDIHGNVWEWTQDCWNPTYQTAPGDSGPWLQGDCLARVLRGGAWALGHEYMRASRRNRYDRDVRYYLHGFRVVRELPAPAGQPPADGMPAFEAAVAAAVNRVFSKAPGPASGTVRETVIIDPLIDGLSGAESAATQAMESRMVEQLRVSYPRFDVQEFSAARVSASPYVLIGTFTGVNKERKTRGEREAFRICLALLDLESGTIASKAKVFSQAAGVDITPTRFFRDSPAWSADPSAQAYIKTCQATRPGDPVDPLYLENLKAATLINAAIDSYEKGQYKKSQGLFESAYRTTGGKQLRAYNGLYLTNWKRGKRNQALAAFGDMVDYGLDGRRFGVKFPFRTGTTELLSGANGGGEPDTWLTLIAGKTARRKDCLEIVGHTHRLGPELLNQRLSIRQAETVKRRLEAKAPELSGRMIATGRGTEENLTGSGTGDVRDAFDRRIEFEAIECSPAE